MRQLFLQHIAFVPLLARVILGILFFFQGFDAVFNIINHYRKRKFQNF